jgi:hypothetical protein
VNITASSRTSPRDFGQADMTPHIHREWRFVLTMKWAPHIADRLYSTRGLVPRRARSLNLTGPIGHQVNPSSVWPH